MKIFEPEIGSGDNNWALIAPNSHDKYVFNDWQVLPKLPSPKFRTLQIWGKDLIPTKACLTIAPDLPFSFKTIFDCIALVYNLSIVQYNNVYT